MSDCEHKDFRADVNVHRLIDTGAFHADIRISCIECGLPFEFPDFPAGWSSQEGRVSPDALELRIPLKPKGSLIFPAIPGFNVRYQ